MFGWYRNVSLYRTWEKGKRENPFPAVGIANAKDQRTQRVL